MKKFCISLFLLSIILLTLILGFGTESTVKTEYLRLHIRADSNLENAQAVKYEIRDAVVIYLTPKVSECHTKQQAMDMLTSSLDDIEQIADSVLKSKGFSYTSHAELKKEDFPTRVYDGFTLEAGVYDALIINLGSGSGNNWWCVVYPPLCFTEGNGKISYRSKIYDIINDFKTKR